MTVLTTANYVFLPWVRQGAASGIQTPDSLSANQGGVVLVPVKLRINDTDDIDRQVRLYGPGDVTGIDPQQVIRTEPRHLATGFEPNYFPAIEFDRPDFPWLFTPAQANPTGKLRPWLCLVIVRKQAGVALRTDRNLSVSILEISAPARPGQELPDLSESWAWAHAQVTGASKDSLKASSLTGDPALTLSRLLCPRRLDPLTEYLACVVPTFDLGRKAGLGLPILPADEQKLQPAWVSGVQSPSQVTLPVYFHWEFRTGAGGDFEELVQRLRARPLSDQVGKRPINISQPGFNITPTLPSGTTLQMEGALRIPMPSPSVPNLPPVDWPNGTQPLFQTALKPILDAPSQIVLEGNDPLLAPPIYGSWLAARHTVNVPPAAQTWLDELNLDPRHRAIAALGTQVVQTQQEQLMASAWEQLGEIDRINQVKRQAQLARAVNGIYFTRHLSQFSAEALLKVVAPAQSRVVVETIDTSNIKTRALLTRRISESVIPDRAVSAPIRRFTSPQGFISTRFQLADALPIAIVAKLNSNPANVARQRIEVAGPVTIDRVSDHPTIIFEITPGLKQAIRFEKASTTLNAGPKLGKFKIAAEGDEATLITALLSPVELTDSPDARVFREAAKAHQTSIQSALMSFLTAPASPMKLSDTKANLLQSLNPQKTMNARVQAQLRIVGVSQMRDDPLEPILDAPEFPQAMYEAVRDLSQDFLFPGLEHVLPDTVALLETNSKFVESFLVGLNTEMSRELLWRNYPTDQRGTYFRHFWDTSSSPNPSDDTDDIDMISQWGDRKLGQNASAGEQLVLLIRSELLRRYPNSVIYAVKAEKVETGNLSRKDLSRKPEDERHPLFRGTLKPDVTFLGFNLTKEEAIAEPGWFFVIQQQPTEPRFGLDVAKFDEERPTLPTWDNLSWRHLANTEEELKRLSHASINTVLPDISTAKWGKNSSHQAYITLQRPVRIAIHAKDMIL
jgi:hypothetical protein